MKKNFKTMLIAISLLFMSACTPSGQVKNQERQPAQLEQSSSDNCLSDFEKAAQRLLVLVGGKNAEQYPKVFGKKLASAIQGTRITCDYQNEDAYGFKIYPEQARISIQNQLNDSAKIWDTEFGRSGVEKYRLNLREITFDKLNIAIAAQAYAQLLGVKDPNFDIFFRTLKLLEF